MAFTGRLGTTDSQPGDIVLGLVPAVSGEGFLVRAIVKASISDAISVSAWIVAPEHRVTKQRITAVQTTPAERTKRATKQRVTAITQLPLELRVTQQRISAVVDVTTSGLRATQQTASAVLSGGQSPKRVTKQRATAVIARSEVVTTEFDVTAVIRQEQAGTLGVNAIFVAVGAGSFDVDAVLESARFSVDAELALSSTVQFSIDSRVQGIPRSFVISSFIASTQVVGSFSVAAYVTGSLGHSREHDHFGSQPINVITYEGAPLDQVLFSLYDMLGETTAPHFTIGAMVRPYLMISAVIIAAGTGAFELRAHLAYGKDVPVNAVIKRVRSGSATISAYMVP